MMIQISLDMVNFNIASVTSSDITFSLPPDHPPVSSDIDHCPVDHTTRSKWLSDSSSASHPFHPSTPTAQSPPTNSLSDNRIISSIPRASSSSYSSSSHLGSSEGSGSNDSANWVYPSERQFFNAMQRKSHRPRAGDMRSIVPIHNAVNERAWEEILAWEAGMGGEKCSGPRLISFAGKPKSRTPKAWINTALG